MRAVTQTPSVLQFFSAMFFGSGPCQHHHWLVATMLFFDLRSGLLAATRRTMNFGTTPQRLDSSADLSLRSGACRHHRPGCRKTLWLHGMQPWQNKMSTMQHPRLRGAGVSPVSQDMTTSTSFEKAHAFTQFLSVLLVVWGFNHLQKHALHAVRGSELACRIASQEVLNCRIGAGCLQMHQLS